MTLEGLEELKGADLVYLEYYTTPHEPTLLSDLERISGRSITVVDRGFVEDGRRILEEAKEETVVLAAAGDPLIATTHAELRNRAIEAGVQTLVVHAATIGAAAASASGLHFYKFSRTVTITREALRKLTQAYQLLHDNLLQGAHTLLLLEQDSESGEGVDPAMAIDGLLAAERNFKRGVVSDGTFALVLSRLGRPGAALKAGMFGDLMKSDFGEAPHCMIVPGTLHFTEVESISSVFRVRKVDVHGNSDAVKRTAQTLVPRYVEKTKRALDSARGKLAPEYGPVVENVQLYMKDAENFLANGEDELAMLSIGYAEGLIDSLNFAGVVKIDW